MSYYGKAPYDLGRVDLDWHEYMHYLYLPVKMPHPHGIRIPQRLEFLTPVIQHVCENLQTLAGRYVYVTARRGYATPGNPINRPGWHTDGFGTADINYIWSDRWPTRFALQDFEDISSDHVESVRQFEDQLDPQTIVKYPDRTLLRLDSSVVHAAPEIPAPGGDRSFLKISVSDERYNLLGNSHNYLFGYDWKMFSRSEVRNDPAYAGGDAGPQ